LGKHDQKDVLQKTEETVQKAQSESKIIIYSPLHKLEREWVQAFGAVISAIF